MLRLCSPSRPTKAKATMVRATRTSTSVKPRSRTLSVVRLPSTVNRPRTTDDGHRRNEPDRLENVERTTRNARAAPALPSPPGTEVEVARGDIGASGETVGNVERVDLLPVV